jgi:hypothetical protein
MGLSLIFWYLVYIAVTEAHITKFWFGAFCVLSITTGVLDVIFTRFKK